MFSVQCYLCSVKYSVCRVHYVACSVVQCMVQCVVLEVINCKLGQTGGAHYTAQAAAAELSSNNSATGLATIQGVNFGRVSENGVVG